MHSFCLLLLIVGCLAASDDVLVRVADHSDRFGAISRQIWESPEVGFHENKSSAALQQELQANGFSVESGVAGMPTALTASWGSGKPVIVLLGEFDALPAFHKPHPWQAAACAGSSIGRKGVLVPARTLAVAGMELFENPALVKAARNAFDKRREGRA